MIEMLHLEMGRAFLVFSLECSAHAGACDGGDAKCCIWSVGFSF